MEKMLFKQQRTDKLVSADRPANLYEPLTHDGGERGHTWKGRKEETTALTWAEMRPVAAVAGLAALALGALAIANRIVTF